MTHESSEWVSVQVVGVDAATGLAAVVIEGQEATGEHPLEPAHMATFTYEEGEHIRALHLETGELIFGDFERARPMLGLLIVYVLLVVGIAWWRGLGALLGLAAAFGIVIFFTVPALFEGADPLITGLVTGSGALAVLLYLVHGLNARTTTAYLGTLARLGVLNDVTVTQSSAIWELRAARPDISRWNLFRRGMRIGRDHIASTVYTIAALVVGQDAVEEQDLAHSPTPPESDLTGSSATIEA